DDLFAEEGRKDGDPDVDRIGGAHFYLYTTIFGGAALGDIERGHDLCARGPGGFSSYGGLGGIAEHTLHVEKHSKGLFVGFNVNITSPLTQRVGEYRVHESHNWGVLGRPL